MLDRMEIYERCSLKPFAGRHTLNITKRLTTGTDLCKKVPILMFMLHMFIESGLNAEQIAREAKQAYFEKLSLTVPSSQLRLIICMGSWFPHSNIITSSPRHIEVIVSCKDLDLGPEDRPAPTANADA